MGVRLAVGGTGVGDRSATVMLVLLAGLAWLAARLLVGPRFALAALVVLVAVFDLAALPQRTPPPYDDLEALYRTDQVLFARLPVSGDASTLSILVQPVFSNSNSNSDARPRFGLAGEVNSAAYQWTCPFVRGIQTIALPVSVSGSSADVQLHLTGAPSRDGDYLIVYASAPRGGFVMSLGSADPGATLCTRT
jgi:hypothetical protein